MNRKIYLTIILNIILSIYVMVVFQGCSSQNGGGINKLSGPGPGNDDGDDDENENETNELNSSNKTLRTSCKEIKENNEDKEGINEYTLLLNGFEVVVLCDMSYDGGGWTQITFQLSHSNLNGELIAIDTATSIAEINEEFGPVTQDKSSTSTPADPGHSYLYKFNIPFKYDEFFLKDYTIVSAAAANTSSNTHDSDIYNYIHSSWSDKAFHKKDDSSGGYGDISFGSPDETGPITSFAKELNLKEPKNLKKDDLLDWPQDKKIYSFSSKQNKFQIGWGEYGTDKEGWYPWHSGTIWVR